MRMRICAVIVTAGAVFLWTQTLVPLVTFAQSDVTGTWRADSPTLGMPWTVVLKADAPAVYGAVILRVR